jgi:microcompartment protein CcmL/EutN
MIKKALGMVETRGMVAAIQATDAMLKSANIEIYNFKVVGSGLVAVLIDGDVASVQSAVRTGVDSCQRLGEIIAYNVIPRPHEEVIKLMTMMDLT